MLPPFASPSARTLPPLSRYIKIQVADFHGHPSMRVGLLGAAQPKLSSSNSACVISTRGSCACSSNYSPDRCESSETTDSAEFSQYGTNEECTISLSFAAVITTSAFDTEAGYDRLTVDDRVYDGSTGPDSVTTDQPLLWSSDDSVTRSGFRICASPIQPPMPPMPPIAPPTTNGLPSSPTFSSSNLTLCVVSTSGMCACTSNYNPEECELGYTGGLSQYGNREVCTFSLSTASTLSVSHFDTELSFDKLAIGGVFYDGTVGPVGLLSLYQAEAVTHGPRFLSTTRCCASSSLMIQTSQCCKPLL